MLYQEEYKRKEAKLCESEEEEKKRICMATQLVEP
jgi:hypothetical protein